MKISIFIYTVAIASILFLTSCNDTNSNNESTEEHGHEHDAHGNHIDDEHVEQKEFTVDSTSTEIKKESDSHIHDDGAKHHNH